MQYNEAMTVAKNAAAPPTIEVRDLSKHYNLQPVLKNLSLTLADGSLCVLVGSNGAGKTTLLRIVASLVRPDAGFVTIRGAALKGNAALRRQIGYLGHQTLFYSDLNAIENLTHYARLYGLDDVAERVSEGIASVDLVRHQHKPVRTYSRGMLQRLAIARALLHDPAVLLLDEPYTGLDKEAAQALDLRLRDLHRPGRTLLIAAHHPQRLLTFASHVAWLRDGRIAQFQAVDRLSETPELQGYLAEAA
jgi:heme ABC exporter ATP-binding subunit CcmA